jgi:phosphorylase kinase alpha/beta subunit
MNAPDRASGEGTLAPGPTRRRSAWRPKRERIDAHLAQIEATVLARQDPRTGLLPASTAVTVHGDYTHAWVRDNVYSILSAWGLALALRGVDAARADALSARVVALMRGLLASMMRQAHKVERFKRTQDPLDALHAKYDTRTGDPVVGDAEWGHLQLDATALFVLFLAQMSGSGLAIVTRTEEVAFVQNLVHYLANAWRTPDYGIWERGHKRNEGVAEINASSVGLAKAALEAVDGLRFEVPGTPAIFVVDDDIARARKTLQGLLPRESGSKETDAALLAVVGWPAHAVEDSALVERTRAEVLSKLAGRYGCKRFLRDGHQTVLEDPQRLHYEPGELRRFEGIESEWPLFFAYLFVDAAMRGDAEADTWRDRLELCLVDRAVESGGERLLPELYFVPAEHVESERAAPGSQPRVPNDNVPLVWAQSLYQLGRLVHEGHVAAHALDPRGRAGAAHATPGARVQVVLLAEDELVRRRLAAHGLPAQTRDQVAPVDVRFARDLQAALTRLGACDALGLAGRPADRLGSLVTSRLFDAGGRPVLFLPSFLDRPGFYLTLDSRLLVDEIAAEMAFVRRHWRRPGPPVLALLIADPMLDAVGAEVLFAFLQSLQSGDHADGGLAILTELLPTLARQSLEGVDVLSPAMPPAPCPADIEAALAWDEAATRPLTPARAAALAREPDAQVLAARLLRSRNPYEQLEILALLGARVGDDMALPAGGSVRQMTEALNARAGRPRRWGVLRRAAALLDLHDELLEDALAEIVAHRKRVSLGAHDAGDAVVARPLGQGEIVGLLRRHADRDARERVLVEEILLMLRTLLQADPGLLRDTLTLRPARLLRLLSGWLAREHGITLDEAFEHVLELSPQAILGRLREVIGHEQEMTDALRAPARRPPDDAGTALVRRPLAVVGDPVPEAREGDPGDPGDMAGGWQAWREMRGVLLRLPEDFCVRVWELLRHCRGLVVGDAVDPRNRLDSRLVHADTTPAEPAFAHQVEERLHRIQNPAYRQLSIEALAALDAVCCANPGLRIDGDLVLDAVLAAAVALDDTDGADGAPRGGDDAECDASAWLRFYARPPHRVARAVEAAFATLLAAAHGPVRLFVDPPDTESCDPCRVSETVPPASQH